MSGDGVLFNSRRYLRSPPRQRGWSASAASSALPVLLLLLFVLLLLPPSGDCKSRNRQETADAGQGNISWETLWQAKRAAEKALDGVKQQRLKRRDYTGARRVERLKSWLSHAGMYRGLPRLFASIGWAALTQDSSWLWGSAGQELVNGFREACGKGDLPMWYHRNRAKLENVIKSVWTTGQRIGSGALSQLQSEVSEELRDPFIVQDMSQAVLTQFAGIDVGSVGPIADVVAQLREWVLRGSSEPDSGGDDESYHAGNDPRGHSYHPYDEL